MFLSKRLTIIIFYALCCGFLSVVFCSFQLWLFPNDPSWCFLSWQSVLCLREVFKASPRPPSLSPPCQSKRKNPLPLLFARPCQYIYLLCLDIFLLLTPRFVLWGPVDGETRYAEWQSETDSAALKYIYQNPTDARNCAFNTQLWKGNYCLLFRFKATSTW